MRLSRVMLIALTAVLVVGLAGASSAQDQKKWYFGLGTGFTALNAEGTLGLPTQVFGPLQREFELSPDDVMDYMETAFGMGGYATDGTWIIRSQFSYLKLVDEPSGDLPAAVGGGTFTNDLAYEVMKAQFTVGYVAYRSENMKFSLAPYVGIRYNKQEVSDDLVITQGATETPISRTFDDNWVDALIGTSLGYAFSPKVSASMSLDAGFGGSNGTFSVSAGLPWKALSWLSVGPSFQFIAVDYENGEPGDADWYLYEADELYAGIALTFHLN
jgi:hypothetical protein